MRVVATVLFAALLSVSARAQTTYTWTGTTDSVWATATNWSPNRTSPATNDILVFDGNQTRQPAFSANETVGRILVSGNATLSILNGTGTVKLTVTGGSPNCLNVSAGDTLTINATGTSGNGQLSIGTGGGVDSGSVTILGRAQVLSTDATNRLVFENGAVFNASQSTGNPFGSSTTGTTNSVEFKSGSTFNQNTGASNPFAKTAPASVVIFDKGSLFSLNVTSASYDPFGLSLSGRTFPNLIIGGQGAHWSYTGSGAGTCTIDGNLTINTGDTLYSATANFLVTGNVTNDGYWNAANGDTVTLNGGASSVLISGSGKTVFHQAVFSQNIASTSLAQDIIDSGSVVVTGLLNAGTNAITGPGDFTLASNTTLGLGGPNGVNSAVQTTGTNTLSTGARFSFTGAGPQVTGTLMPDTVNTIWIFTSTGVTLSKTTTTTLNTTLNAAGSLYTGPDTLFTAIGGTYGAGAFIGGNLAYSNFGFTGAWIFPVGQGITYLPVTINVTAISGSGTVVVAPVDGSITKPTPSPDSLWILKRYFKIGNTSAITSFTADVTLSYSDDDMAGIGVTNDSLLHVYQYNGSSWADLTISSRDVTNNTITVSGLTSFGSFVIGTRGPEKVTIAEARKDDNHDLIPDYSVTGDTLEVFGVVTTQNIQAIQGNTSYCIQDGTAGIDVFAYGTFASTFNIGDSVFVIGKVAQYHGLTEIVPLVLDSVHFAVIKHGATVPAPLHLSLHNYVLNAETYESQLIAIIDTLYKTSGTWPTAGAQSSVYMTNQAHSDTAQVFISKNTNLAGWPEPVYPISVVGVISQYSPGSTVNAGYEIVPRDTNDVQNVAIAPPSLLLPANNVSFQRTDTLMFKWSRSVTASKYLFQLSTTRTFSSYVVNDSNVTDTTRKVTGLLSLTKYYWRVSSYNVTAFGAFSATDSLTTIIAAPVQPVLVSPVGGVKSVPRRTTFKWNACPNATKYRLQVASDTNFTSVVFDTTLADTSKMLSTGLSASTKHYWRVSASDTGGTSPYATASYTTGTGLDGIDEQTGLPKEFALYQNYPNPFNPTTTIGFALPKESQVRIEVFNVLGQRVELLVDGVVKAGNHVISFNAGRLASGVYFYIMRAGDRTFKQKMLLMK